MNSKVLVFLLLGVLVLVQAKPYSKGGKGDKGGKWDRGNGGPRFGRFRMRSADAKPDDCPVGLEVVECLDHPCANATCEANPEATCVANYCGGCNTMFYDTDGKRVHCDDDDDKPHHPKGGKHNKGGKSSPESNSVESKSDESESVESKEEGTTHKSVEVADVTTATPIEL